MFQTRLLGVLLVAALTASTSRAELQDVPLERMRATFDGDGVIAVESGRVPGHLVTSFGLWTGYASDLLVLRNVRTGERLGALVGSRVGGSLVGSIGLGQSLLLGVELPVVWSQSRPAGGIPEGTSGPLAALSGGVGDLRIAPKWGLLSAADGDGVDLAILVPVTFPTSGGLDYRGESSVRVQPELAVSWTGARARLAANVATPLRPARVYGDQRIESELLVSVGGAWKTYDPAEYEPSLPIEISTMLLAGTSLVTPLAPGNQVPVEARAQASYRVTPQLDVSIGGGVGLHHGLGTPDGRLFAGVRFNPSALGPPPPPPPAPPAPPPPPDTDGDGLVDPLDQCPNVAEDRDGHEDDDGCPDPDDDVDGVPDARDRCPADLEDTDGFEDDDGCPDLDDDADGVPDAQDHCGRVAEDKDGFEDEDGCPDLDDDADGVPDASEARPDCIRAPEDKDGFQDEDGCVDPDNDADGWLDADDRCPIEAGLDALRGCPDRDGDLDGLVDRLDTCVAEAGQEKNHGCAKATPIALTATSIEFGKPLKFKGAALDKGSRAVVEKIAAVLAQHPELEKWNVVVAPEVKGKPEVNLELAQQRASAVLEALVQAGVGSERLAAKTDVPPAKGGPVTILLESPVPPRPPEMDPKPAQSAPETLPELVPEAAPADQKGP